MAATKIRITIVEIEVLDEQDLFGAGEWYFEANVTQHPSNNKTSIGSKSTIFEAREGDNLSLNWRQNLDIDPSDTTIEIRLKGMEEDLIWDDDLGSVLIKLNPPITHAYDLHLRSSEGCFIAHLKVDVIEETGGRPGRLSTIVEKFDSDSYTSIHDEQLSKMVHICPVIPVPWATGIPPLARGVKTLSASDQVDLSVPGSSKQLNALVNPSLIPAIFPSDSDFNDRCARIRITQFRPKNLDLSKLIWKASANIKFWNGSKAVSEINGGQEVKAYGEPSGDTDEEGLIEVRWDGEGQPLLARYRAWVGKPKIVWTRANIIKTSKTVAGISVPNPSLTAAQVEAQIDFQNVLLWQSGIMMVMDNDKTAYNGAVRKQDGIFEITTATNYTYNVPDEASIVAPLLNLRSGVFNVAYIHSLAGHPGLYGMATDRRLSTAESNVTDSGDPSTSWVRPTGVFPDDAPGAVVMKSLGPSGARDNSQTSLGGDGSIATISGCLMTQFGATTIGSVTLAHELGHVIGLHHRGSGGGMKKGSYDKVNHMAGARKGRGHPWEENVMTYGPNRRRQDFDLIQTQVMRGHALLKDLPPNRPAPPKTPPKPAIPPSTPPAVRKDVPAAWLPTSADKKLVQGYLGGTKPGLRNSGYDLGTSGPASDGVDGIIGKKTRSALRSFQTNHGSLDVDGVYGPNTQAAFDAELNSS